MPKKIFHVVFVFLLCTAVSSATLQNKEHNLTEEQLHAVMGIITNFILSDDAPPRNHSVSDTTPPVITLNGANPLTLKVEETYQELGATAIDNRDGNLTSSIKVVNNVDTTKAGTYTVTYTSVDKAGNQATETRQIIVEEISLPELQQSFEKAAKSLDENSSTSQRDMFMKKYLAFSHKKAQAIYDDTMAEPLSKDEWSWIWNDDYIKESSYALNFPANPYVVKNIIDFKNKFKEDDKEKYISDYKNVIVGLSANAREHGIFKEAYFGDTFPHPVLDYVNLHKCKQAEEIWKSTNSFENIGVEKNMLKKYLLLKYEMTYQERNNIEGATNKFKRMKNDGIDIAYASYEDRKKYNLSFFEKNVYRLVHGMERADCYESNEPCARIESYINSHEEIKDKTDFLIKFSSLKNKVGLINMSNNAARDLMELLGVAPNQYKLMSFYDFANWKIMLDQIPPKKFNDDEPDWPIFNASLKYNANNSEYPWQMIAMEHSAQKKECKYIKKRFFETDRAALIDIYPKNAINKYHRDKRFIKKTTYTWSYEKPEKVFKKSDWTHARSYYRILEDGGVCGRLSTMEQHLNECLNRPGFGAGQPGHRALFTIDYGDDYYYVHFRQSVSSAEKSGVSFNSLFYNYSKGIRSRGVERFAGMVKAVSPAQLGERKYNSSMILQHAAKYMEDKDGNAVSLLRLAIKEAPTNIDAWYQLTMYYVRHNQPQKIYTLAHEFMDKKLQFDKLDPKRYDDHDITFRKIVGKHIMLSAQKIKSIDYGRGEDAESFKQALWKYLDKYEKEYRSNWTYAQQNELISHMYGDNNSKFTSELKELFNRYLSHTKSAKDKKAYFNGVDWGTLNKNQLIDEMADRVDDSSLSDGDKNDIKKKVLRVDSSKFLANFSLSLYCSENNVSECKFSAKALLDAPALYITSDKIDGLTTEVDPGESGQEGVSHITVRAVDNKGNGVDLTINIAKIDSNGLMYKINDPVKMNTDKTKIVAWLSEKEKDKLAKGISYSLKKPLNLKVTQRDTNTDLYLGRINIDVKNLMKSTYEIVFSGEQVKSHKYLDEESTTYFSIYDKNVADISYKWAEGGYTALKIKVKDDAGNMKTMTIKATKNDDGHTIGSGTTWNKPDFAIFSYDQGLNPDLPSNTHYKSVDPVIITAYGHSGNGDKAMDRFKFTIDMTTP